MPEKELMCIEFVKNKKSNTKFITHKHTDSLFSQEVMAS